VKISPRNHFMGKVAVVEKDGIMALAKIEVKGA
jgi:molybdopterin-binding protein